jgi:alpha-tubulin suppressor-like RCC1 family protein
MSIRQHNLGSIVKPGFNALGPQTSVITYQPYLYSWGNNEYGQLGLGDMTYYSSPKQVGALTNWLNLAGGYKHSIATKSDGTLWTWGYNINGALGLGNTTNYSSPKQVGSLTTWSYVTAGYNFSAAIKTDGTLWTWGVGTNGQLGHGNTTNRSSPVQVGALTTWLTVAAGYRQTGAVKTDGTLWMWGGNDQGQLGLGNTTTYSSPKQVGALTNWKDIRVGYYSSVATKTDGTIWTWGASLDGALGLGNTTYYSSPKQVGALTTWLTGFTSNNSAFTVATKTDGTLWSWGYNGIGQLGLGNTTNFSSPKQVGLLTNWKSVTLGMRQNYTVATKTDGTLWTWGYNVHGQLGLGNTTHYSSPKQVGALTNWLTIASGTGHVLATLY